MIKNKSGQGGFLIFMLLAFVFVIIFAIVTIPMAKVFDDVADKFQEEENFGNDAKTNETMTQVKGLITPAFDQLVFVILIGGIMGIIGIAIFSDFHPYLLIMMIIAIVIFVIIGGLMTNVYDDLTSEDEFKNKAEEFTLTNAILGPQFPIIIAMAGVISIVILFSKRGRITEPL